MTSKHIGIGIVILVVLGVLGYLVVRERQGNVPPSTATSTTPITISTTTRSSPGYTVKVFSSPATKATAPDYTAPLSCASSVPAEVCASDESQLVQAQATIKADPTDFNAWIALGDARDQAGDYTGAEADWQYMSALYPTNTVSFANLGDLYQNYLHEYPRAVAAYKQEIINDPKLPYIYMNMYQLYAGEYPQSSSVITALLQKGIAANPTATELQATLSAYQAAQAK
jgi:tetratricopeptide (TPR) repeat protein